MAPNEKRFSPATLKVVTKPELQKRLKDLLTELLPGCNDRVMEAHAWVDMLYQEPPVVSQQSKESEALVDQLGEIFGSEITCPHYGKAPVEIGDVPDLEMVQKMHMWGNCLACNLREAVEKAVVTHDEKVGAAERERCAVIAERKRKHKPLTYELAGEEIATEIRALSPNHTEALRRIEKRGAA